MGHPKVYVGADCPPDCLDREGIIKCKLLPPRSLYYPVLPYKNNSKLMFPLFSACTDTMNIGKCTHSDEERVHTGNITSTTLPNKKILTWQLLPT